MTTTKSVVEYAFIVIMLVGAVGGIINRLRINRGIGLRFIQFLGLTILVPVVALLSLEERISQEMTGAIVAAAIGGVLAGIGSKKSEDE